jgi:uncharacterized protein (TIGR02145 family)
MAENLNIGSRIDGVDDQTDNENIEKYCYNDNEDSCDVYGGLYQWDEMMEYLTFEGTQGICPTGWHVPTDNEWCTLENEVDYGTILCSSIGWRGTDAGSNLKETGTNHWNAPNTGATNSSGFTDLPGGFRYPIGSFTDMGTHSYLWSSSESGTVAQVRGMYYTFTQVIRDFIDKAYGFSVRCLKDAPLPTWSCGDTLVDSRDAQSYETVQIGEQCWMAENLNVGARIDGIEEQLDNSIIEKYCYNDIEDSCDTYGGLYQWDEMMKYSTIEGAEGICPNGWHVPTDEEWKQLEGTVDSQYGIGDPQWDESGDRGYDAGLNLKSNISWANGGNGIDLLYFTAMASGYRHPNGTYSAFANYSFFRSSTDDNSTGEYGRRLYNYSDGINREYYDKNSGFSVRCLKD